MLLENLTTDPLYYLPFTDSEPVFPYHDELREPPRVYDQSLSALQGLFALRERTLTSDTVIYCFHSLIQVEAPGYSYWLARFDGATGAYIDRVDLSSMPPDEGIGYNTAFVSIGRVGDLWHDVAGVIKRASSVDWRDAGEEYSYTHFTPNVLPPWAVDKPANRILSGVSPRKLGVWNLATGDLISSIDVGGVVQAVFLEDLRRAYVVLETGIMVLVDYDVMRIMGIFRVDLLPGDVSDKRFAWDPFTKRILVVEPVEDDANGASNTVVRGYYPIPLATGITPPIPLKVPRKGRTVPVLVRAYGNTGEGIGGKMVTQSSEGDGTLNPTRVATDARGYAAFNLACDDSGTEGIDLQAEQ